MVLREQTANPQLLMLGMVDEAASTANGSSLDTPRPSVPPATGGTKLKLNFSAISNGVGDRD